jgi:hypothetical protein
MKNRYLSWENVQTVIESGNPFRFPIEGTPRLDFVVDPGSTSIALLLPDNERYDLPQVTVEAVQVEKVLFDGTPHIRLFTRVRPLYREFYSLLTEVADSLQLEGATLESAISMRLRNWKELLREVAVLSVEAQLGLLGELWTMRRLVSLHGMAAIDGWTGPTAEPHDFRVGSSELEVKSTRSRQRVHIINGLAQLQPSEGLPLYLLSLQFEPANTHDAFSLPLLVSAITSRLVADAGRTGMFENLLLNGCGYRATDEAHYQTRYRLRTPPVLVAVNEDLPRLTRTAVTRIVGEPGQVRIGDVTYSLNVEGMGFQAGTEHFCSILGAEEQ